MDLNTLEPQPVYIKRAKFVEGSHQMQKNKHFFPKCTFLMLQHFFLPGAYSVNSISVMVRIHMIKICPYDPYDSFFPLCSHTFDD